MSYSQMNRLDMISEVSLEHLFSAVFTVGQGFLVDTQLLGAQVLPLVLSQRLALLETGAARRAGVLAQTRVVLVVQLDNVQVALQRHATHLLTNPRK